MSVGKQILIGIPIMVVSQIISDSWLSGWGACCIWYTIILISERKKKKINNLK